MNPNKLATSKRTGGGLGILLIVAALAFIVGPNLLPFIPGPSKILLTGFGVVMLVVGFIITVITHLYVKTSADMAFVRTGSGGPKVVQDGGAIVVPTVHNIVWVSLETMKLAVKRHGETALITGDKLRADITSEFFIKVAKKKEDILAAATSLGAKLLDPDAVLGVVEDKLVSALRDVAAKQTLNDLNTKRSDFIAKVQEIVSQDLAHNGLTLETVTISFLDQTPLTAMKADQNIFDAEGALTIANIVSARKIERNKVERQAEQTVRAQDVAKDKFVFEQDVVRAQAEAEKDASVRTVRARKDREAAISEAEQSREAELARVQKEKTVQVAEVQHRGSRFVSSFTRGGSAWPGPPLSSQRIVDCNRKTRRDRGQRQPRLSRPRQGAGTGRPRTRAPWPRPVTGRRRHVAHHQCCRRAGICGRTCRRCCFQKLDSLAAKV